VRGLAAPESPALREAPLLRTQGNKMRGFMKPTGIRPMIIEPDASLTRSIGIRFGFETIGHWGISVKGRKFFSDLKGDWRWSNRSKKTTMTRIHVHSLLAISF
jgi:hypothetical protein